MCPCLQQQKQNSLLGMFGLIAMLFALASFLAGAGAGCVKLVGSPQAFLHIPLPLTSPSWTAPQLLSISPRGFLGTKGPNPLSRPWTSVAFHLRGRPASSVGAAPMFEQQQPLTSFDSEPTGLPSPLLVTFFSAMFASAVTTLFTFPLDTLKTQQQSPQAVDNKLLTLPGQSTAKFFASLFRGLLPVLVGGVPCSGIYFLLFELLQSKWNPSQTILGDLLCAFSAQIVSGTLMVPVDLVKVNRQVGALGGAPGPKSMMVSLFLTYLRDFSFACTQMLLYTVLRRFGCGWEAVAGPVAATAAALVSHPFDALRTRRMLSDDVSESSTCHACMAGLGPRLALSFVSGFIFFNNYEAAKPWVQQLLQKIGTFDLHAAGHRLQLSHIHHAPDHLAR
eukprot:GGOE01000512.1.p1 GENE.GGOE01000512.1~~GGOE01000512.1.p1  ORF type:complete len:420 (-),score=47.40 GGOE01000512.1:373-1548(-)